MEWFALVGNEFLLKIENMLPQKNVDFKRCY